VGCDGWNERRRAARELYENRHTPEIAARAIVDALRDL
jgi:hypothetical protein